MTTSVLRLETLSDDVLLARLAEVVVRGRRVEAEIVWHLAEVDRRKLYRREACPSMHVYATSRLHLSDHEAYLRITVARVSRRFPVVLSMLAQGRLHLSAIAKLAPHLHADNVDELLARAVHRSKRDIEMLVATLAPRPDVPSLMRRLPTPTAGPTVGSAELGPGGVGIREVAEQSAPIDTGILASASSASASPESGAAPAVAPIATARATAVMQPLAPSRYKVQFTADEDLHAKITRAQALLRHQIPDGDLAAVVDRAMTLLVRELERVRFAATSAPRKGEDEVDPAPSSRRIPDPIKRAVWQRDEEQCTFRDRDGRRCPARERLEYHHLIPFARGGDHSASNITLRCSSHNAHQADHDFGADFMARHRRGSPAERARPSIDVRDETTEQRER
jgi:hypothetical protein